MPEAVGKQCFLKKARKNFFESGWRMWQGWCLSPRPGIKFFLEVRATAVPHPMLQSHKVFLFLFVHKKKFFYA
jgi:hypothetical protein